MADAGFGGASTRREQIRVVVKLSRSFVDGQRFTLQQTGVFLGGLNAATISQQNELSLQSPKLSGRSSRLSDAVRQCMLELIRTRFDARNPVTYPELVDLL
jgi:hypothetical protein